MQVRVFESQDMASGLKLVRKELGPNALILSTRTVRHGKLGLLGKPTIQITAAINASWTEVLGKSAAQETFCETSGALPQNNITVDCSGKSLLSHNNARPSSQKHFETSQNTANCIATSSIDIRDEVKEIPNIAQQLAKKHEGEKCSRQALKSRWSALTANIIHALYKRLSPTQHNFRPVTSLLEESGIDEITSRAIAKFAIEQLSSTETNDSATLRCFLAKTIERLIKVKPPLFEQRLQRRNQSRIALIGPTGSGKTTTVAKLAAHYLSSYSPSIALLTMDTRPFSALEQLKVHDEIITLPVDVVLSPEQLRASLKRHEGKDLVLIDTAGRSPRDTTYIQELASFFPPELGIEKHLVLSATTRENELLETIRHFNGVNIDRTIYTKIDECLRIGAILNVQLQNKAPLSYITNGQRVPEDLVQLTRRSVAELIMSHNL